MTTNPGAVFGSRVREFRSARKMSQAALSKRLRELGARLDRSAIARIESATRGVTIDEAVALAAVLDVPFHTLLITPADEEIALTPALTVRMPFAAAWLVGEMPLDREDVERYSAAGNLLMLAVAAERSLPHLLSEQPNEREVEMARALALKARLEAEELEQTADRLDVPPDAARQLREVARRNREKAEEIEKLLPEEEER
jgi:transcriptional regulator with XRE-family HTH domain